MRSQIIQRDSKLIGDELIEKFISQDKKVLKYIDSFYSNESVKKHSENKSKNFTKEQRQILVKSLKSQYSNIDISKKTSENISSLSESNTFCITTGHQLNLFTGPLMVIFKIAQVISISNQLNLDSKNFKYVPVLWIASEDHDFEEISEVNLNQKNIKWEINSNNLPVGEIEINNFKNVLRDYKDSIIDYDFKEKIEEIIDNSYKEGDTLSISTIKFINSLFSEHGLIIIDANKKDLKSLFIDQLKNEIDNFSCKENTTSQISELKKDFESYKIQVNPSDINFFKLTDKGRKRIRYDKKLFNVDDENSYNKDEILNLIDRSPELFSPNAIMRP
ncbi:MAG: bacillithiol biosynthesis protein BshC, partial [Flavobacteriaceae bacterium]